MKKLVLIAFYLIHTLAYSQTATDFTAIDCNGISHNLFSELNSGKVIVICWVMPCSACTGPALTTLNVVNTYISNHPNTVYMYLCDDYANTTCTSLDSWKSNNSLTAATSFSDASINMADYGAHGMPKIIVIGGGAHTVFYTANDAVDAHLLQNAIDEAVSVAGITEQNKFVSALSVSPNPASSLAGLKFNLAENSNINIQLFNLQGKIIEQVFSGNLSKGDNNIEVNTGDIAAGTYLVKVSNGSRSNFINLVVVR